MSSDDVICLTNRGFQFTVIYETGTGEISFLFDKYLNDPPYNLIIYMSVCMFLFIYSHVKRRDGEVK